MVRNHLDFLCDVSELSAAFSASSDSKSILPRLVKIVARHLQADVCSIYVFDTRRDLLEMHSNVGLKTDELSPVRLKAGVGLVGTAFERRSAILDNHASANPLYKRIPSIGEEQYDSFLAVPLVSSGEAIGVIAVQRQERDHFAGSDLMALKVVASQLVGCVDSARALSVLTISNRAVKPQVAPPVIHGLAVSGGTILGNSRRYRSSESILELLSAVPKGTTLEDFQKALQRTISQIEHLQTQVADRLPEAVSLIFSAHLMILKDRVFTSSVVQRVQDGETVGAALASLLDQFQTVLLASSSTLIREKVQDLEDVAIRLVKNLSTSEQSTIEAGKSDVIIAREILPSELVLLSLEDPAGLILVEGAVTSHVSILARSFGLPVVITKDQSVLRIEDGTGVLMDGYTGNIYVSPEPDLAGKFEKQLERFPTTDWQQAGNVVGPAATSDGEVVKVRANVNLLSEIPLARQVGADGIGLYRTEFPFMIRSSFPDEESQYIVYRKLVDAFSDSIVTFRTVDVGGDKTLRYSTTSEVNPELGLRGIRFSLRHRSLFTQQLKAILRAGATCSQLRIMFPMVSSVDQFRTAAEITDRAIRDLEQDGIATHRSPQLGIMLEVPSVVETIAELAEEADFLSIGSNDFVQYMLAADRGNEGVREHYQPHHPSVMRALGRIVGVANDLRVPISICGEMAQKALYLPFMVGIGIRDFSVAPSVRPELCKRLQTIEVSRANRHADQILGQATLKGVENVLDEWRNIFSTFEHNSI